jgi:hypothetical protein
VKGSVRLVCRFWKNIADSIYLQTKEHDQRQDQGQEENVEGNPTNRREERNSPWIKNLSLEKAASYGPCKRFDAVLPGFKTLQELDLRREQEEQTNAIDSQYKYQYDVDIIRIQIRQWPYYHPSSMLTNPTTAPKLFTRGLSTILMRPSILQVLYIAFNNYGFGVEFPVSMLQGLPSLRTLGIGSDTKRPGAPSEASEASKGFFHPTLTTLIINIPTTSLGNLEGWNFPNLHTLSIDPLIYISLRRSPTDLQLQDFFRRHSKGLRSLRIMPCFLYDLLSSITSNQSISGESTTTAPISTNFLGLETLAMDFLYKPFESVKPCALAFPNVKHFIQISTYIYSQKQFCSTLLDLLTLFSPSASLFSFPSLPKTDPGNSYYPSGSVRRVESITITEKPPLRDRRDVKEQLNGQVELKRLNKFCKINGIHVYGDMGKSHRDVRQAWDELRWQMDPRG